MLYIRTLLVFIFLSVTGCQNLKESQSVTTKYADLGEVIPKAINAVASLNSLAALLEKDNIERAGKELANLLEELLKTRLKEETTSFQLLLDNAIDNVLAFLNMNLLNNDSVLTRLDNQTIALYNNVTHTYTPVEKLDSVSRSTDQLMEMIERIEHIESMDELLELMDRTTSQQETLRSIGAALHKIGDVIGLEIDFTPIEAFSFQLG